MALSHFSKSVSQAMVALLATVTMLHASGVPGTNDKPSAPEMFTAWTFHEDFSEGIPGWMSFPLSQDVGYDPSVYTARRGNAPVLVRDVTADGQQHLKIGLLRPLRFHATAASIIRLEYTLHLGGPPAKTTLTLGSVLGRRYMAVLSPGGGHQVAQVNGRDLGISASGDDIEVVVIETAVNDPAEGSHNLLTVLKFEIEAERRPEVPLLLPRLTLSKGMQIAVADTVCSAERPLRIQISGPDRPATLILFDGSGKEAARSTFTDSTSASLRHGSPGLWRAAVESGGARTEFRFLVLGATPSHPRVLLTSSRIAQLKADAALRDLIHRKAGQSAAMLVFNPWAGQNIEHLSPDSVLVGLPQYFTLMENYSNTASLGALDYVLSGNTQGLELARKVLLEAARWPSWTPPWFAAQGLHTYYETGIFSARLALAYDLIAGQLSQQEKSTIADGFLRNAIEPAIREYFLSDRLPIAASNHMAHAIGGAIADCVALEGDLPEWPERFAPGLAELIVSHERLIQGLFPGDGSEAEPAGYEDFAMEGMSWGAAALDALGIHSPGMDNMLTAFWWERYIRIRPDLLLDSGDFHGELSSVPGFAWSAEYANDPALRAFYENENQRSVLAVSRSGHRGAGSEPAPGLLDLVCCTKASPDPGAAPPSRIFPLRGSAVLRSGWNEEDTVISLRAGPWFNHEHHDQGSFQVSAFGEKLIAEAGYSDYYKDPRYVDYFTQAAGHNTVLLDRNPFSQGDYDGRYWAAFASHPSIDHHLFSKNMDYLVADLGSAYKGSLQQFTREYFFLKPRLLLIRDRLSSAVPHQYTWLLHAPPGTETSVTEEKATISGTHGGATISAPTGQWAIVTQPIPVAAYGDFEKGRIYSRAAFVLETPKEATHTFLVGMQFYQQSQSVPSINWRRADNRVHFDTREGDDQIRGSFRTASEGELTAGEFGTDGDSLAVSERGTQSDVLATGARSMRAGATQIFSASFPVDVMLEQAKGDVSEFHFACRRNTTVRFLNREAQAAMLLDGKPVTPEYRSGGISLGLTEGEHVVIFEP